MDKDKGISKQILTVYVLIPRYILTYGLFTVRVRPTTGRGCIVLRDSIPEEIINNQSYNKMFPSILYRKQFRTDRDAAISAAERVRRERLNDLLDEAEKLYSLNFDKKAHKKTADREDLII